VTFVRAKRKSDLPSISEKQYQTPARLARHCQFLVEPPLVGGDCEIGAVDRLGFLGSRLFCRETPRLCLLDFLGFPWILSSESRLFNGLRGFLPDENFSRPFAAGAAAPGQAPAFLRYRNAVWLIE
jgi:hypothetical protein